jgi:hypothetical protein
MRSLQNVTRMILILVVLSGIFWACQKNLSARQNAIQATNSEKTDSREKESGDLSAHIPPYNLNVFMHGQEASERSEENERSEDRGFGFLRFRQNPDTARIIDLDISVFHLAPMHSYLLERAVDPITNNGCSSTAWLILGKGLVPQAIHTNHEGNGKADLFRNVTSVARGTELISISRLWIPPAIKRY